MTPITKSQTKKNRGAIPVSFIAMHNILEPIMPTEFQMHKLLFSAASGGE